MSISNPSSVVSFDADAAREAIEAVLEGPLYSLVEYDADAFNPLYVDDETMGFYEDEEEMLDHFEQIHSYVHLDFAEMELFVDELLPVANRVEYIATGMDVLTFVRIYVGSEGLFVAVDPDEPVEPIVEAIKDTVAATA